MRKTKDWEWSNGPNLDGSYEYSQAQLSVLMDIRDELKRLNNLLHCHNFVGIPHVLSAIKKNTTRKKRKVKAAG